MLHSLNELTFTFQVKDQPHDWLRIYQLRG